MAYPETNDLPQICVLMANGKVVGITVWPRHENMEDAPDEYNSATVYDYGEVTDLKDMSKPPTVSTVPAAMLDSLKWEERVATGVPFYVAQAIIAGFCEDCDQRIYHLIEMIEAVNKTDKWEPMN